MGAVRCGANSLGEVGGKIKHISPLKNVFTGASGREMARLLPGTRQECVEHPYGFVYYWYVA
jgi:hypothetical protein